MILISQRNASTPCEGGNCYGRENSADEKERHGHAAAHPAGLCCYRPAVFLQHHSAGRKPVSGHPAHDLVHRILGGGHLPVLRPEGVKAPGSTGAHPVRRLHRHSEGTGLLLGEPLLHRSEPGSWHQTEPERRCEQRRNRHGGPA